MRLPWGINGAASQSIYTMSCSGIWPEPRADLYVRKDNAPAQAAYKRWGWTKIGDVQPSLDAPNFDELIIKLPVEPNDQPLVR